jgi:regulator of sigma E protease
VEELRQRLDESDYAGARQALGPVRESIDESRLSPVAYKSAERGINEIDDSLAPDAYWRARTWKRVAVIFAGPGANLLLAVVLFAALFMVVSGDYRFGFALQAERQRRSPRPSTRCSTARRPSPSGMRAGDRIVAINGQRVAADEIAATIRASGGPPAAGDGGAKRSASSIFVRGGGEAERYGVGRSTWEAVRVTGLVTREIGASIGRLVTGDGRDEISSPVGIVQGSSEAVEQGADAYLWVLGLISLSLALLNLLPLLPLDGGHIAFSLIEGIRGKAVAREVYERVSVIGIAIVLLLFFIGLSNDIGRLGS